MCLGMGAGGVNLLVKWVEYVKMLKRAAVKIIAGCKIKIRASAERNIK